jgi:hypothetical protein
MAKKQKPKGKPRGKSFLPGNKFGRKNERVYDAAQLLMEDLRQNRLGGDWMDSFRFLAHNYMYDGTFAKPETRYKLFPLLRTALFDGYLKGPSKKEAHHLYLLWEKLGAGTTDGDKPVTYAQPKVANDATAIEEMFGPLQKAAREKEAREQQQEAERQAAAQAAEDKLYASAFLNKEAQELYRSARLTGKFIIAQLVDGRFLFQGEGESFGPITKVTAHLTVSTGVGTTIWVKKARTSDQVLVDTGEELLWTTPETEESWVETPETMTGLSKAEASELHSTKMVEKEGLGKGHAFDLKPVTKTVSPRLQKIWERFLETRKHVFTVTGKDEAGRVIGTLEMRSEVNLPFVAEGIRQSEYQIWEANRFALESIPQAWSSEGSLRDMYAHAVAQGIKSIAAATVEKFGKGIVRDPGDAFDAANKDAPFKVAKPHYHGMRIYGREQQQPKPIAALPGDISFFIESLDRAERVEPAITALTREEAEMYGSESKSVEQRRRNERLRAGLDPLGGTRKSRGQVARKDYPSSQVGISALYDASASRPGFDI